MRSSLAGKTRPWILSFLVLALTWPATLLAGAIGYKCFEPFVWEGAAVNAVILPYRYAGTDERLSDSAEELTLLVQTNVLFSLLKYGKVGASALSTHGVNPQVVADQCDARTVLARVLERQPGAISHVQPGKGVVLLWGYLYEEGQDIFVQSYVRFLRNEAPDSMAFEIKAPNGQAFHFNARLPDQAVAFPPQRLTKNQLKEIGRLFRSKLQVRREPKPDSTGMQIPLFPDVPFQYWVKEARQGWMRIEAYKHSGPSGWIQTQFDLEQMPLSIKLPELFFVDAAAGYLRFRIYQDDSPDDPRALKVAAWVQKALAAYKENARPHPGGVPMAMAEMLSANLDILTAGSANLPAVMPGILDKYRTAVRWMPYNINALNLTAIIRVYLGHQTGWKGQNPGAISREMKQALALDPRNRDLLDNLEKLYLLAEDVPESIRGMGQADLEKDLSAVKRVRKSLGLLTAPKRIEIRTRD